MTAEYQHIHNYDGVTRTADNATIPPDGGNRDWNEYQAWLAEGNTPDPAPPPPDPVPPPPDPNLRLDQGLKGAVDTYNNPPPIPAQAGGQGGLSVEERLHRLEEALKAMCSGQAYAVAPVFFTSAKW